MIIVLYIDMIVSTLLHSERPKLYAVLVFVSAIGLYMRGCISTPVLNVCHLFRKGGKFYDFLFASVDENPIQTDGIYSYRSEFSPLGEKSLL